MKKKDYQARIVELIDLLNKLQEENDLLTMQEIRLSLELERQDKLIEDCKNALKESGHGVDVEFAESIVHSLKNALRQLKDCKAVLKMAGYGVYEDGIIQLPRYCPKCNKLAETVEHCRKCRKPTKTTADLSEHCHGCGTHARYVPKTYRKPNA